MMVAWLGSTVSSARVTDIRSSCSRAWPSAPGLLRVRVRVRVRLGLP